MQLLVVVSANLSVSYVAPQRIDEILLPLLSSDSLLTPLSLGYPTTFPGTGFYFMRRCPPAPTMFPSSKPESPLCAASTGDLPSKLFTERCHQLLQDNSGQVGYITLRHCSSSVKLIQTCSLGYLIGNYPDSWLLQHYPTGKVLAISAYRVVPEVFAY